MIRHSSAMSKPPGEMQGESRCDRVFEYELSPKINLHVPGRIAPEDAERQTRTASEILKRLRDRPGQILADEVGMGKTFVALAVVVSVALQNKKKQPIVVMVPPSVKHKWPRDFETFREHCLPEELSRRLTWAGATTGVEFLKFLDDRRERRKSVIFLTHGALASRLSDGWVQFAVIQAALKRRRGVDPLKRSLARFAGDLLHMTWVDRCDPGLWEELLKTPARNWLQLMRRRDFDPERNGNPGESDDPVPRMVLDALDSMDMTPLFESLKRIPMRRTASYSLRMKDARGEIRRTLNQVWLECVQKAHVSLPLLVLDEAHHLKNPATRLASLFHTEEADSDVDEVSNGALAGMFERMLFLTATPFQLGHHELCNVLTRFEGVDWRGREGVVGGLDGYRETINRLRQRLDAAQHAARQLDAAWSRLRREDLTIDGELCADAEQWWIAVQAGRETCERAHNVLNRVDLAQKRMREAEQLLRDWVIRNTRSPCLPQPFETMPRRRRLTGAALREHVHPPGDVYAQGLAVEGKAVLPFLLATRLVALTPESRPVFAEGLASSFEAFRETRRIIEGHSDGEAVMDEESVRDYGHRQDERVSWYLDRIDESISRDGHIDSGRHPKLKATVDAVMRLWRDGEKVLVFCHYIATGRALRHHLSRKMDALVKELAHEKLGCAPRQVAKELEHLSSRFDADAPAARACNEEVAVILSGFNLLQPHAQDLQEVVRRFVRTPTFLVRYFDLSDMDHFTDQVHAAFANPGQDGRSLRDVVTDFFRFLVERCGAEDRTQYIDALKSVQTGEMYGIDITQESGDKGRAEAGREGLVATVRLVNGATRHEIRQRLMLAFNTPFYPEVLIASSVMAEGVDLHLNCRHVIHYDLSWNPSTVEQRTGRVDRIGAKAERVGHPINVFMPYIAQTQDEKMFRVVMDRERWFEVLMGGGFELDLGARHTDQAAERVPLPAAIADFLSLKLNV